MNRGRRDRQGQASPIALLQARELVGGRRGDRRLRSSLAFSAEMVASLTRVRERGTDFQANGDEDGDPGEGWNKLRDDTTLWHDGCVNTAAWNTAGDLLCTGSDDGRAKIWHTHHDFAAKRGGDINTGHSANIFHCSFVPQANDRQVLTCAADGQLRLSDFCASRGGGQGEAAQGSRKLHEGSSGCMTFMFEWVPGVPVVLTAPEDGRVSRVDLREKSSELFLVNQESEASTIANHGRGLSVKQLAFGHHSEHILALGGQGASIKLFDIRRIDAARPRPVCVAAPPGLLLGAGEGEEERAAAAAGRGSSSAADALLRMLRVRARDELSISGLQFSSDGRELLASYHGDQIYSFNVDEHARDTPSTAPVVRTYGGHLNYETFLKSVTYFGPRDEYVISGSDSGHALIWERASSKLLRVLEADSANVNGVVPHPQLPLLVSYGIDSNAKIWAPCEGSRRLWGGGFAKGQQAAACEDIIETNLLLLNRAHADGFETLCLDRANFLECCRLARKPTPPMAPHGSRVMQATTSAPTRTEMEDRADGGLCRRAHASTAAASTVAATMLDTCYEGIQRAHANYDSALANKLLARDQENVALVTFSSTLLPAWLHPLHYRTYQSVASRVELCCHGAVSVLWVGAQLQLAAVGVSELEDVYPRYPSDLRGPAASLTCPPLPLAASSPPPPPPSIVTASPPQTEVHCPSLLHNFPA